MARWCRRIARFQSEGISIHRVVVGSDGISEVIVEFGCSGVHVLVLAWAERGSKIKPLLAC